MKNTGAPITVPVGPATLGRIMNVLGSPIDERGPVSNELSASIHRKARPTTVEPVAGAAGTGIKVIDLIWPVRQGGRWVCSVAPASARP